MNNMKLVSIAIPNEYDLEVTDESVKTLESFGVPCEVMVVSAHRSTEQMVEYTKNAMIAAFTILPVIAVPLRSSLLDGLDSVLSMLQMPSGVPVATV
jgi:5-(carboxyamino)imidazole ribonucleotide mutase